MQTTLYRPCHLGPCAETVTGEGAGEPGRGEGTIGWGWATLWACALGPGGCRRSEDADAAAPRACDHGWTAAASALRDDLEAVGRVVGVLRAGLDCVPVHGLIECAARVGCAVRTAQEPGRVVAQVRLANMPAARRAHTGTSSRPACAGKWDCGLIGPVSAKTYRKWGACASCAPGAHVHTELASVCWYRDMGLEAKSLEPYGKQPSTYVPEAQTRQVQQGEVQQG